LAQTPLTIAELPPDGWRPATGTTPVGATGRLVGKRQVTFNGAGQIIEGIDFANVRVANAGTDRAVVEGTAVTFTGTLTDPNPANGNNIGLDWVAQNPSGAPIATGTGTTFTFTPPDNGTYKVLLTATDHDDSNRTYVDTAFVFVQNAAPTLEAGADAALLEG